MGTYIVILIIIAVPVIMYNSLISKKNSVRNSFSSIDVMLKKRCDLIPNLVSAVKGYMHHERNLLEEVTNLRAKAANAALPDDQKIIINGMLSKAITGVMVAVENYPDLKSSENFLKLQAALNEIEEQISAARRAYNASVNDYNNAVEMFPTNIMASMMNYQRKPFFEASVSERMPVNTGKLLKNGSNEADISDGR
jgi:LemA protein